MSSVDWGEIRREVTEIFGAGAFRFDPDKNRAMIVENNAILAIVSDSKEEGYVNLHLRASLMPNVAAYIAASINSVYRVNIDENFDINNKGVWLFGDTALIWAAKNIKNIWFENIDSLSTDPIN